MSDFDEKIDFAYWIEELDHYICSYCDCDTIDTNAVEYGCKWFEREEYEI